MNDDSQFDDTDGEDLSFTSENNYDFLYEEANLRKTKSIKEKYFDIFNVDKVTQIGNNLESSLEKRKKVTWGYLYEKVIMKIVQPFVKEKGNLFVTQEEIDRRIGIILKDRDIDYKLTSQTKHTDEVDRINRFKNLKNECQNYIPILIN
jgi:hypothetical protein